MLTSRQNPLVKTFRKLHQAKYRRQYQISLLEGTHLLEAAQEAQWPIKTVCFTLQWQAHHLELSTQVEAYAERVERVSDTVLSAMTTTQNPDGVVALIPWHPQTTTDFPAIKTLGILLSNIQDPGNLGTILRSAVATNADVVFLSSDCVDLSNPKVLRASVGAWFKAKTQTLTDIPAAIQKYQQQGVQVIATTPNTLQDYWSINWQVPSLVLIGNEGAGLSDELISMATHPVKIPLAEGSESLNAAIATSLILFESQRQRQL